MKNSQTRIIIADDHLVVRMGMTSVISFEKDMSIVGEAETGLDAVRKARQLKPDVIIMDLMMPEMNGASATAAILRELPQTKIIILTSFTGAPEVRQAVDAGAVAVLDKDSSQDVIISAIRDVVAGKSPSIQLQEPDPKPPEAMITPRQAEVLKLVAKGFTNKEIAGLLNISPESVKEHIANILIRLDASSRSEAVAIAMSEGWLHS